jgi:UDP-N-acetylglucosamine acyltransferase
VDDAIVVIENMERILQTEKLKPREAALKAMMQVSGNCIIYDNAILTSNVLMQGNTRLGSFSVVQGGCRFIKDIPPYIVAAHEPIAFYSINTKVLEHTGFSETIIKHIAQAYRILYKANTSLHDALGRIREQIPNGPEIENIIQFVETSKLGIIH